MRSGPDHRPARLLDREVAPFGALEARFSGLPLVENPDPVLAYLSEQGEATYRLMERTDSAVAAAKGQRVHTLLSAGTRVEPGPSGTRDAEDLADWAVHFLKGIDRWPTVLLRMLDAVFFGWVPMNLVWAPFSWRGRQGWGVSRIFEKRQELFRFTTERHLAFIGDGFSTPPVVYRTPEAQLRWLVCTSSSLNNPYGEGVHQRAWLTWFIKARFLEMWSKGMARSMGTVVASEGLGGQIPFDALTAGDGDAAGKSVQRIADELAQVIAHWDSSNVLIKRAGWDLEILSDIAFAEGWRKAVEYLDEALFLEYTHESLTMRVGAVGSKAAAETQRKSLLDVCQSDGRQLEGWINDGLLHRAIHFNFGDVAPDDLPRVRTLLGKRAEPERVQVVVSAGVEVDWKALAEQWHVPVLCDATGEVVRRQASRPAAGEAVSESDDDAAARD